jgi:hypothetical protein
VEGGLAVSVPDTLERLRELASAAFDLGYRTRFLAIPSPTVRDRLDAQYGPMGEAWRWYGPWRRVTVGGYMGGPEHPGWERMFVTPTFSDGRAYWCHPVTGKPGHGGYGDVGIWFQADDPDAFTPGWVPS